MAFSGESRKKIKSFFFFFLHLGKDRLSYVSEALNITAWNNVVCAVLHTRVSALLGSQPLLSRSPVQFMKVNKFIGLHRWGC